MEIKLHASTSNLRNKAVSAKVLVFITQMITEAGLDGSFSLNLSQQKSGGSGKDIGIRVGVVAHHSIKLDIHGMGPDSCFVAYLSGGGRPAQTIHSMLMGVVTGKSFYIPPDHRPKSEVNGNENHKVIDVVNEPLNPAPRQVIEPETLEQVLVAQEDVVNPTEDPITDSMGYRGFFDDKDKLHTAVIALLSRFPVESAFGFDEFAEVMHSDVGLPDVDAVIRSKIRVFKDAGYLKVCNPDRTCQQKVIYAMTEDAATFARTKVVKTQEIPHITKKTGPKPKPVRAEALQTSLEDLKRKSMEYLEVRKEIEKTKLLCVELEKKIQEQDPIQIESQIKSFEARLSDLRDAQKEIARSQSQLTSLQEDAIKKESSLEGSKLKEAHIKFEELKREFFT